MSNWSSINNAMSPYQVSAGSARQKLDIIQPSYYQPQQHMQGMVQPMQSMYGMQGMVQPMQGMMQPMGGMMMMPVMVPMMMPQPIMYPQQYGQPYPPQEKKIEIIEKKQEPPQLPRPQVTIIRDSNFTYYSEVYDEAPDESVLNNANEDSIPKMKILVIGNKNSGKTSLIRWMMHREYIGKVGERGSEMTQNNILVDKSDIPHRGSRSSSTALVSPSSNTTQTKSTEQVATEYRKVVNEPGIGTVSQYFIEINGSMVEHREAIARLVSKSFDAILIVIDHTRLEEEYKILQYVVEHLRPVLSGKKLMIVKTKCDEPSLLTRSQNFVSSIETSIRNLVREHQFYYFEYLSLHAKNSSNKIGPSFGTRLFNFFLPLIASKTRN